MKPIELYSYIIIRTLEKNVQKLRNRVYGKNFLLTRKIEKKHLEKMENLLFKCYDKLSELIDKET